MYKQYAQQAQAEGRAPLPPPAAAPAPEDGGAADTSTGADMYKQYAQQAQAEGRAPLPPPAAAPAPEDGGAADTSTGADMYKQYAQQAQAEGRAPLPSAAAPPSEDGAGADTSTGADMFKRYAQQAQAEGRAPLPSARPPSHASDTEILGWFRGLPQQPQGSTSTGADLYKQYAQQAQAEGRAPLPPAAAAAEDGADGADTAGRTLPQLAGSPQLFFTYGSLKSNFPNHNPTSALLGKLVGACSTVDKLPLIVPKIPSCSNSACGFLHRIAALVHRPGTGHCVHGELYEVDPDGLIQLDKQQQYLGPAEASNVHDRLLVEVKMEDGAIKQAHCYFSTDAGNATSMHFTRKLSLLVSRSAKVKPFQCMLNQASQL